MSKQKRSWFYIKTSLRNRFVNLDKPPQSTMENLTDSILFRTETEDRAKPDDGTSLDDITGHVVLATDSQAKDQDAQKTDRTIVVAPNNLTSCEAEEDTLDDFTGDPLELTVDGTRDDGRNYLFKFSSAFKTWLLSRLLPSGGTTDQILVKQSGTDYDADWGDGVDELTKISSNDTTSGYLEDKLEEGSGIVIETINDGGNETLRISATQPEGFKSLYVNSNNTEDGDGSILNPFMTLDLALDEIDNESITDATVQVAGGTYIATRTLARYGISWNFETGAVVNANSGDWTGVLYLFDTTGIGEDGAFSVSGEGEFYGTGVGILHNPGDSSNNNNLKAFTAARAESDYTYVIFLDGVSNSSTVPRAIIECGRIINLGNNVCVRVNDTQGFFKNCIIAMDRTNSFLVEIEDAVRDVRFIGCTFAASETGTNTQSFISASGASSGRIYFKDCTVSLTNDTLGSFLQFESDFTHSNVNGLNDIPMLIRCEFRSRGNDVGIFTNIISNLNVGFTVQINTLYSYIYGYTNSGASPHGISTGLFNINDSDDIVELT